MATSATAFSSAAAAKIKKRLDVLGLYRKCLRCAQDIPDHGSRATFDIYIRDGFYSRKDLFPNSRQAELAIQDAQEQLERMLYFQSIMAQKQTQKVSSREKSTAELTKSDDVSRTTQSTTLISSDEGVVSNINLAKMGVVEDWLSKALPELHMDDLHNYVLHLVKEGFDSLTMLEQELVPEDLDFMKTAHKRVLLRVLNR
eukprot:scaffold421223_cov47-Attheya_sp.AAC.2